MILAIGLDCFCASNASATFPDDGLTSCRVQGYVYHMGGELVFTRVDLCAAVRSEVKDNAILFTSPRRQVAVVPPPTRGQVPFWYGNYILDSLVV